jgi:hypothetical protein
VKVVLAILLACAPAYAQHDHSHAHDEHHAGPTSTSNLAAGASLVAASFDQKFYGGDYLGVVPSAVWSNSKFAAIASIGVYRISLNGATYTGLGDVGVHAQAQLLRRDDFEVGVLAGISLPSGDDRHGLGMGHLMLMPGAFATWTHQRVRVSTTLAYGRALGRSGHEHGAWPIVSPMLMAEVSWNAGVDVRITDAITAGARASGGLPAGEGGTSRAIIGGRVGWRRSRLDTSFELQAGVVGDPFSVRGVLATSWSI